MLPVIQPGKLTALKEPIDHPGWLYEIRHDGFRGMLCVDEEASIVSRSHFALPRRYRHLDPIFRIACKLLKEYGVPDGIRTRVIAVKAGWPNGTDRKQRTRMHWMECKEQQETI